MQSIWFYWVDFFAGKLNMIMKSKIFRKQTLPPEGAWLWPDNELHYHELYLSIITVKKK